MALPSWSLVTRGKNRSVSNSLPTHFCARDSDVLLSWSLVKQTIQTNARLINQLHARINEAFAVRTRTQEDFEAWQCACTEFHKRYDALAFPGGLKQAYTKIRDGDLPTVETAISFLETHPYFHCSQYIATKLTRLLKRHTLPARLQDRLDIVLTAKRAHNQSRRARSS